MWAHLIFVLPLSVPVARGPMACARSARYAATAASLGAASVRVFLRLKLPLLLRPVLIACAVAFAVSVRAISLPTLFAGNGRVATPPRTDAVTLSAGADRRVHRRVRVLPGAAADARLRLAVSMPAWRFIRRPACSDGASGHSS